MIILSIRGLVPLKLGERMNNKKNEKNRTKGYFAKRTRTFGGTSKTIKATPESLKKLKDYFDSYRAT